MTGAAQAIAEGCGLRFIGSLVQQRQDSGLSEQQAVYEIVRLLDDYQKEDPVAALALIKHLREWTKGTRGR
jgi:hypothetical protein